MEETYVKTYLAVVCRNSTHYELSNHCWIKIETMHSGCSFPPSLLDDQGFLRIGVILEMTIPQSKYQLLKTLKNKNHENKNI